MQIVHLILRQLQSLVTPSNCVPWVKWVNMYSSLGPQTTTGSAARGRKKERMRREQGQHAGPIRERPPHRRRQTGGKQPTHKPRRMPQRKDAKTDAHKEKRPDQHAGTPHTERPQASAYRTTEDKGRRGQRRREERYKITPGDSATTQATKKPEEVRT